MTKPEELTDHDGKWIRRDVLVDEVAEEDDTDRERIDRLMDELLEEGPCRSKRLGTTEYVQLESMAAGLSMLARNKSKQHIDRARSLFHRGDDSDE